MVSGPSGVGKGTVLRRLVGELVPSAVYSVSCTTRPPRPGEVDGRDYRFLSKEDFDRLVEQGAFLEWAEVFGHRYGTLRVPVEEEINRGRDVILEIDVQGAAKVRERVPEAISVFIAPPSEQELALRLAHRSTEVGPELERRLAAARAEMSEAQWFDDVVVNDDVERVARKLAAILGAAHSRTRRGASRPGGGTTEDDRAEDR